MGADDVNLTCFYEPIVDKWTAQRPTAFTTPAYQLESGELRSFKNTKL